MKHDNTPEKGTKAKPFIKKGENPEEDKPTSPPSGGWGDSEHDTRLHKNLKPHSDKPNYDPEWGRYRHEE
jgi:hypothetical protein